MEKERKIKIIAIVSLIIVVIGLTIGYAALSSSLDIKGTATVDPIKFGVRFENLKLEDNSKYTTINGEAYIDESRKSTTIDGINVAFKAPNDYVIYSVDIVNEGSVNVEINSFNVTGIDNNEFISYTLKYDSNNGNDVMVGDVINANSRKKVMLKIYYKDLDYLPEENVILNLGFEITYVQSNNTDSSAESGTEEPWKYKVDETGTITAYNYAYGPVVKVPAEVDGVPVKTITRESFLPKGNVEAYQTEAGNMYMVIHEEEPNYTNAKEKLITMFTGECGSDTSCIQSIKSVLYSCKDKNTCYNVQDEEDDGKATKVAIPEGLQSGSIAVNPNPSVGLEESFQTSPSISTLDLSEATSLESIEESAFYKAGITSVTFGENSKLKTIGNYAFYENQITDLNLPSSVTTIGGFAFQYNQISSLTISSSVTTIAEQAFYGNQISSLDLSEATNLKTIGDSAFDSNQINSLDLSGATKLTTIGDSAFQNNQISGELVIPSSVTFIGNWAFYENQISSLSIPSSVTTIGDIAFTSNPLSTILIKRTEEDFLANVTVSDTWYDGSPTITYQP